MKLIKVVFFLRVFISKFQQYNNKKEEKRRKKKRLKTHTPSNYKLLCNE